MVYKIFIFLFTTLIIFVLSEKLKNYGAFKLVITKVEICRGPKTRDCGEFRRKINNNISIDFDFLINESFSPNKGKVLVITNRNEVLRLKINKPCENVFMKPVLKKLFNATNNCVIRKGHYIFALDFQGVLRSYYGGMHLYGLYTFKSIFYGDHCNLSCSIIEARISGAAGLWAGAGVTMRPKHRDEQTLIGGTIWSQIIIPIGLMISKVVEEEIDLVVEGYYLCTGILLLWITGIVLIVHEAKTYKRREERLRARISRGQIIGGEIPNPQEMTIHYDKAYYAIGVLCVLAGGVNIIITGLLAFGAYWTTKYLMNMPDPTLKIGTTPSTTSH